MYGGPKRNLRFAFDSLPRRAGGVYFVLCNANDRIYVGQTHYLRKRLISHAYQLIDGRHENAPMQDDWNVYGPSAFEFGILTISPFRSQRLIAEACFIRAYQSTDLRYGYNKEPGINVWQGQSAPSDLDLEANAAAIKYRPH